MRKWLHAFVLLALGGCDDPSLELSATIRSLTFSADPAQADALATIDLTVDLEARNASTEVTLERVTAFALPRDDGAGVGVAGVLMNPQGQGNDVVRLESGELVTVRVTNGDVTSGAIAGWCSRPAQVEVEFAGGDQVAEDSADATVLCP
jgi:hypothetical protein